LALLAQNNKPAKYSKFYS